MNFGPLIFLAAFFAMGTSWFAFVLGPSVQIGRMQPTNTLAGATSYPLARPGLAQQGLQVYRANGCGYCHSQQVDQTGVMVEVVLTDPSTNPPPLIEALQAVKPGITASAAEELLKTLPQPMLRTANRTVADNAVKALTATGAKAQLLIVPVGPDIARGWGKRRSIAEDFLYDSPAVLGSSRIGPDLANVGIRLPDPNWHLRHLYAPRAEVKGSTMPTYPFLFETRKTLTVKSAEAIELPAAFAPPAGYEVVPTPDARALVAYLLSLKADAALFSAPMTVPSAPPAEAGTNAPGTNAPANGTQATTNAPGAAAAGTNAPAATTNAPAAAEAGTNAPAATNAPAPPK